MAFVSSFIHSFFDAATSPSVFRVWDIFYLFQHIATTSMLHLNYPSVYTTFSTNFAWSFGLFTASSVLQPAIERMRYMTQHFRRRSRNPTSTRTGSFLRTIYSHPSHIPSIKRPRVRHSTTSLSSDGYSSNLRRSSTTRTQSHPVSRLM